MKVSIIIPLYNGEKYLGRCLKSVLSQDYADFEVIIVDDGSTDDSLHIAKTYESSNVHVYTQINSGAAIARNLGIEKCSHDSRCVFFVDCDDCIAPTYLSSLIRNYNTAHPNLPFCELMSVGETEDPNTKVSALLDKVICFKDYWENEEFLKIFTRGLINSSCNKCYSLEIIRKNSIRFNKNYPEDTIFNLEYLKYISEVIYVSTPLYYYIKRAGSITSIAYPELYDNYISIQKELYNRVPEKFYEYIHEFVYPQYLANTRKFMQNGDNTTILHYLRNTYVKKAIKSHKSTCFGDLFVKKCLQYRLLMILNYI